MKYKYLSQSIPQNSRRELSNKILYLVDNGLVESSGITCKDIYNTYTGNGGLRGLRYSDYSSYSGYSNAKKEIENSQLFTPDSVYKFIMDCLSLSNQDVLTDLTCGMGNFFNYAPMEVSAYDCELDVKAYKVVHYLYPGANLTCGNIRSYEPGVKLDYIIGDPPFNLRWWVDSTQILFQLYCYQETVALSKPIDIMALVVPKSFLADDFSDSGLIKEMERHFSFPGQFMLHAGAFASVGAANYEAKV